MPEYGFEPMLGLELSRLSCVHFLKVVFGDFLRVLRFPPLHYRLMVQPIE